MQSILMMIKDSIEKYASVLAEVLKVDVEIVDCNLDRVAGTGMFSSIIGGKDEFHIYKQVLESGEMAIIDSPGECTLCGGCPGKESCRETFEMSMPVRMDSRIIGVIGFVCDTEEAKRHIVESQDTFVNFLTQIADLIASKAKAAVESTRDTDIRNILEMMVNRMEKGAIVYTEEGVPMLANKKAKDIFRLIRGLDNYKLTLQREGYHSVGGDVFTVKIGIVSHSITGSLETIELIDGEKLSLLIFSDINEEIRKVNSIAYSPAYIDISEIMGEDAKIVKLKKDIIKVAKSSSTVLVTGESGTGKEMVARAVHKYSFRKDNAFIAINCAAIPDTLIESELFGYEKGAFTGSDPKGKAGKFELAHKGTLFLDEIGDMPLYLQAKLLRVLQAKKITRLGSAKTIDVDVRVIAATNQNLQQLIKENKFREDLYYRLNVIPMDLPPLRERRSDVPLLVNHFIEKYSVLLDRKIELVEDKVMKALASYDWPGNIRELENTVEYLVNLSESSRVTEALLPGRLKPGMAIEMTDSLNLEDLERDTIKRALSEYGLSTEGKKLAADKLGIGIASLYRKINRYNIS